MGSQGPDSQGTEHQGLADQLCELIVTSHGFGGGEFLPASSYKNPALLNEAVVREELGLEPGADELLVQFALTKAPKVLIALVSLNWPQLQARFMQHFMKNGFHDEKLPVTLDSCSSHPAFNLKDWKMGMKRKFCAGQWEHMAPVFSETNFIFRLEPIQPLPFLKPEDGEQKAPEGASSVVHKVKVHEDHIENPPRDVSHSQQAVTGLLALLKG